TVRTGGCGAVRRDHRHPPIDAEPRRITVSAAHAERLRRRAHDLDVDAEARLHRRCELCRELVAGDVRDDDALDGPRPERLREGADRAVGVVLMQHVVALPQAPALGPRPLDARITDVYDDGRHADASVCSAVLMDTSPAKTRRREPSAISTTSAPWASTPRATPTVRARSSSTTTARSRSTSAAANSSRQLALPCRSNASTSTPSSSTSAAASTTRTGGRPEVAVARSTAPAGQSESRPSTASGTATLIPIPITTWRAPDSLAPCSTRIPPSLRSRHTRSFGHLSPTSTPHALRTARRAATPAASGSAASSRREVAMRIAAERQRPPPGGTVQRRPRRPRPACW